MEVVNRLDLVEECPGTLILSVDGEVEWSSFPLNI
jgi:hypothetical protein